METERFKRIEAVFEKAVELPPNLRETFLDEACRDDPELKRHVASLLEADRNAGPFMEQPAVVSGLESLKQLRRDSGIQARVGRYRLLRKIGEGGMSEVHLAVRADDEYRKSVALKIIRRDHGSEDLLRRFRTERQILAGLDHPNIAKLLDGGSTENGIPYFVMDYIEGVPIDRYCDQNGLSVVERLGLFRIVCSAVQYAHQNLVVHRDIKASNILVTADGVPKLLDFGIAKLVKPDQFARPVEHTATWLRPMTPQYASPEQLRGKLVGTASDIYSLGVLLYKLLTGHLPYELAKGQSPEELQRLILEEQPERPSTIVDLGNKPQPGSEATPTPFSDAAVGRTHGTNVQQLRRQLSGDLDNIVLMALRKEALRRYSSAEQFSEDIRRYLEGRPVVARKDTLGYRAAKFLRRHRLAVGAATAVLLMLIGFAVTMAVQASRVARERDQARLERDRAQRVVEFLEEIFSVSDPMEGTGENITAREILDRGADRVSFELDGRPEIQTTLMGAIGNVYRNLGLFDRARPLLEQSLRMRRAALGDYHPDVAQSLYDLGALLRLTGDLASAESRLRECLQIRRELQSSDEPSMVETLNRLGIVLKQKGEYAEAESLYREALRTAQDSLSGIDRDLVAESKNNLAALMIVTGDLEEGERLLRESLALRRELLGPRHPLVALGLSNLGAALGMQGRYDDAEPYLREALAIYREVLDPQHPSLVEGLNNLGRLLQRRGNLEDAEPLIREALDIERARVSPDHPNIGSLSRNLAELLQEKGDLVGAELLAREALATHRRSLGDRHVQVATSLERLGSILIAAGRPGEAEPVLRDAVDLFHDAFAVDHWRSAAARSQLGECLTAMGRFDEAEPLLLEAHGLIRAERGAGHPRSAAALRRIIELYDSWGRPEAAAEYRALLVD